MKFQSLVALCTALVLHVPAHGQNAGQARVIKSRCITFQTDQELPPLFAHQATGSPETPGVPVTVKSYLNHEAESLALSGDEVIFTSAPDRASITLPDKLFARFKVPAQLRSAILMFLPGDGKPGSPKCLVLPIEDTTRAFPRGSLKVLNLSHFPLRIELESKPFDFKSGESRLIEDPPVGNSNSSAMRAFTFQEEQWQRIAAGSWPHPGQKRVLQVAFDNPVSRQVEMRGIRDIAVRDPE